MNKNLSELLKNHIDEYFYNPLYGYIKLYDVDEKGMLWFGGCDSDITTYPNGTSIETNELVIFPSREQRDWDKWAKECSSMKIWNDVKCSNPVYKDVIKNLEDNCGLRIELTSALALIKIQILIGLGYGGSITNEEWRNTNISKYSIECLPQLNPDFKVVYNVDLVSPIAFHTKKQAEEFISYSENIELLRDFYMI